MAINTIPELVTLLNNVDIDATVLSKIVNDAPNATGSGLSPGFVTTRLGVEVKNAQKAIADIEADLDASIQLILDNDTSILRTVGDQAVSGVKTFNNTLKLKAMEFPAGADGTIRTFDTLSLALGANNKDRFVIKGTDGISRLVGLGAETLVLQIGDDMQSTGSTAIEVGRNRIADGNAYVDLVGDTIYTDFGSRFSREPGVAGRTVIAHRGAGDLTLESLDTGAIQVRTNGATAFSVSNDQTVKFNSNVFIENNSTLLRITDTSGVNDDVTDILQTAGQLIISVDQTGTTSASAVRFDVDGVERARIDSTGVIAPKQIRTQIVSNYGLILSDQNARVLMDNSVANTVTIPTNASQAFPIGTEIRIIQINSGTTSITAAAGVTLNGVTAGTGALGATGNYTDLLKVGTNTWWAVGDIGAVA